MFGNWFSSFASPKKLRAAGVMGMNARNYNVISKLNNRRQYPLVDDKVQTKILANRHGINTPGLIGVIEYQHEVRNILNIVGDYKEFVIKPAHGSGGRGVLVVRNYYEDCFTTASGKSLNFKELYQYISNILSGLYSLGGQYDAAVIEELVHFSNVFHDYSFQGIPDVRVIVYKGFPAMSMMRLATRASGGRANLHQGAVGVGLDIRTGHTLHAVMNNLPIEKHPDTGVDLLTLKVPLWREHLEIASKAYEMTGLGYLGADIVLDEQRGPMMLELNARPGLAIQIANLIGLSGRLKEIDETYPRGLTPLERVDYVLGKLD